MNRCECGFIAKSPTGLAAHRRQKHPQVGGDNRRALERTLELLRFEGRLENLDAARVQMLRSVADKLDKGDQPAQLWKVYGEALEDITRKKDEPGDDLKEALAAIRGAGPLGNVQTP